MNKQIEKIANDLRDLDNLQYNPNYTANYQRAVGLHSLGYRKQSEVAREIFAKVLSLVDEIGLSANEVCHAQMLSGEAIRGTPDTMRSFGKLAGIKRVRDAILELKTKYEVQEDEQED